MATILDFLGLTASASGRDEEAVGLHREALGILSKTLSPWNSQIATLLYNLGSLYLKLNRLDEAESALHRSIQIRRHNLGPSHPDVGNNMGTLAQIYALQGQDARAEAMARQAVAIL